MAAMLKHNDLCNAFSPARLIETAPSYPEQWRVMLDATFAHRAIDWGHVNAYAIQVLLNQR